MSFLRCHGLSKSFDKVRAVDNLSMEVGRGQIAALVGPSGCGKTTVLRLIAGFERPDSGSVSIGKRTLVGPQAFLPPEKRRVGMVFQEYALFPHMTVEKNIRYGVPRNEPKKRIESVIELVGLEDIVDRFPSEISGGQQQRVALARALAPEPDVLLLDEPFSSLDATLRNRVRQEVRDILKSANATAVFVTHDQEEALSLADTVSVMRNGQIEESGSPESVYGSPSNRWVASFLGGANVIPGVAGEGWVECELARFGINPGFTGPAEIVIRPESVAIAASSPVSAGGGEHKGVVTRREFYGHNQLVVVELESGLELRSRRTGFPAWHPGDRVRVWVDGPVTVLPEGTDLVSSCPVPDKDSR